MAYNISEVSGTFTGGGTAGLDTWTYAANLSDPSLTVVTGDFNAVTVGGVDQGEASDGYAFSPLSTSEWGTLTFNTADGTFSFIVDRAAVIGSGADQTVTFTVTGTDGGDFDTDTVTINILICVARGTLILTDDGQQPVEELRVGDRVLTWDNGLQPIRWIGSRVISADELQAHPALRPIRIAQGALSDGKPQRDLLVSPQHRVLLTDWRALLYFGENEVLVPAKGLLNDHSIHVDRRLRKVEYFHIMFDRHQIIMTEGAPTESFHPGPNSLSELHPDAYDELMALFPELARNSSAYGPASRPSLRVFETEFLTSRRGASRQKRKLERDR